MAFKDSIGKYFAAFAAIFMILSSACLANTDTGGIRAFDDIREGRFVLAPQAFLVFCRKHPSSCEQGGGATIELTPETAALLRAVNEGVNRRIVPVALQGPDVWDIGRTQGHCAIYAVQKRQDLIERGIPAAALSLAVVSTSAGVLHLVLVVHTSSGAVVLDNLAREILPWSETSHSFHSIQSRGNPMLWVSVAGRRPAMPRPALPESREPAAVERNATALAAIERHFAEHVPLPPPVDAPLIITTIAVL